MMRLIVAADQHGGLSGTWPSTFLGFAKVSAHNMLRADTPVNCPSPDYWHYSCEQWTQGADRPK
jgi:hypothetical protein